MIRKYFLTLIAMGLSISAFAQLQKEPTRVFQQPVYPVGLDNYNSVIFYYNGNNTYNLRHTLVSTVKNEIQSLKVNPASFSFSVLYPNKDKSRVEVFYINEKDKLLHRFPEKEVGKAQAICYTPDARMLMIACGNKLRSYELSKYTFVKEDVLSEVPTALCTSRNGYFLAGITEKGQAVVWNLETKAVRKTFSTSARVNAIAFSPDSKQFGILTANGKLQIFDTRQFEEQVSIDKLGQALTFSFHPDGKYVAIVTSPTHIEVVNTLRTDERDPVSDEDGSITYLQFVRSVAANYMAYNTAHSISYKDVSSLTPYYTRLMEEELGQRMDEWLQRMPGETLDEYQLRVNDENRNQKTREWEEEISTRLASDLVTMSSVTLGSYNAAQQLLALEFSTMPTIFLSVPAEDVSDFDDTGNLEFHNVKYGLNRDDTFEMVYADIYNKKLGKTYTFDNRERRSLEYLRDDEGFVPLEYIQQASMEEVILKEIKEKVVEAALEQNVITDHTQIAVNARVVNDYDADGKQIYNYEVSYKYDVEEEFSPRDDFPSGRYQVEQSAAAMSMLAIVKESLEGSLNQYLRPGKKLKVQITGSADASPVRRVIPYQGVYGDYVNEPIYQDGELTAITVTKEGGITKNEQLAFLRALGVKNYIEKNVTNIDKMQTDFTENIEVSQNRGSAFRRISVVFTFVDAF
jgi:hypothetical protein